MELYGNYFLFLRLACRLVRESAMDCSQDLERSRREGLTIRQLNRLKKYILIAATAVFLLGTGVRAQNQQSVDLVRIADSLRLAYEFSQAADYYQRAIEAEPDSTFLPAIEDKRLMAENGLNMMDFAYTPNVVAKHRFSIENFFLYYPLKDKSWRAVPNILDSLGHPFAKAVYFPDDEEEIYFSAEDEKGVRNVWMTEFLDTIWSAPVSLTEQIASSGDEVYPILSDDGKYLYFASKGLYGVGGYDLYVSEWNNRSRSWGAPTNLGFPYSSPYDDILFCTSFDGRYTVFASNRACPADSVDVYVLEHDSMPIRSSIESADDLRKLMALEPDSHVNPHVASRPAPEPQANDDTKKYMAKMEEVRTLRSDIYKYGVAMDEARNRYAATSDATEKASLSDQILQYEMDIPRLRDSLDKAQAELQDIEMEFLKNGVVIDIDRVTAEADIEVVAGDIEYKFLKMNMGDPLEIEVEPSDKFDYTFMILPQGQFAPDNTLPSGVVYQIQIFSSGRQAKVSELKGLSPVFCRQKGSGYIYSVGLFRTHKEASSNLSKVRQRGFSSAFIVAFLDGKQIKVDLAKTKE